MTLGFVEIFFRLKERIILSLILRVIIFNPTSKHDFIKRRYNNVAYQATCNAYDSVIITVIFDEVFKQINSGSVKHGEGYDY